MGARSARPHVLVGLLLGVFCALALVAPGPAGAAVETVQGTLVQTIHTSQYGPPSPDPAGIVYVAATDRFLLSDSEVDEMSIYQGSNLFTATRSEAGTGTGTTIAFSQEPSGVALNPADNTLFVSDDDRDKIFVVRPGADGRHGTGDDTVTNFSTAGFGNTDPEDVAFDVESGHLFISDGGGVEVFRIDPVTGVFGDANDVVTHFDVALHGSRDAEGLGIDPQRGHVLVLDPSTKSIYELTRAGDLVRIIDCRGIPTTNRLYAGVTMAPTSNPNDPPSALDYWIVDRQVDNGTDPNENDGKLYEVSAPSADAPPGVTLVAPAEGATVSGTVLLEASASDDIGVTQVAFSVDGTNVGTDTNGADGWSVTWDTTTAAEGGHTVTAAATDTLGQTASDANGVTVDNVASPPTVALTSPAEGSLVSGSVVARATASGGSGVVRVAFSVDGVPIGTDSNGADGWSVTWNTTGDSDGSHTVAATATDAGDQTATDTKGVVVDNGPPVVDVSSPAGGATVSGGTTVRAAASDNQSVASVQFFVDGASIGTDSSGGDGWSVLWDTTLVGNGGHALTALARDAAGNSTTSAPVQVSVDNAALRVVDAPVGVGNDDVDELQNGTMRRTGGDLELGADGGVPTTIGLRFTGVQVPRGATVSRAYVQFQVDEKGTSATSLSVRGESSDNSAAFTSAPFNASSRPRTSASVAWQPPAWSTLGAAGADQRTPDLSSVVQEIVDRPGWAAGHALAILVTGSGRRTAESFEGGAPPILHIEYDTVVDETPPSVSMTSPTEGSTLVGTATLAATASDNQSVASVQFLLDGVGVGTDSSGGDGWSVSWDTTLVANGGHVLTALARDVAGNWTTSAPVQVSVDNPTLRVVNARVGLGNDDVDELQNGTMRRTGGDLELGADGGVPTTIGLRFTGIQVPRGATVARAWVQFQVDEKGTSATSLSVRGESSDNAAGFTSAAFNASSRPRTSASVAWQPPAWSTVGTAGADQRTPDLSAVVQEIVDRPGWAAGHALAILVTGSGRRTAESFEGGAPPILHIEYELLSEPAPPENTSPPTVAGTAEVGQALAADPGAWTGDTPVTYAYQWRRCDDSGEGCADIASATGASYAVALADAGATLRVRVTATNSVGSAAATSSQTAVVQALPLDGLSQIADSVAGSSVPTYYASNHRVAVSGGGRQLAIYGRHEEGVQLVWRDPGGAWQTATRGEVSNGLVLGGTGTGDWSASIAVARDATGKEHAWVVWSSAAPGGTTKPLQMRHLSSLDDPAGPRVGPIVTLDAAAASPTRPDIAFERAPDGSFRGCVVWTRLVSGTQYELVAAWFSDLSSETPALHDTTTLFVSTSATRNPTLAQSASGLRLVARLGSNRLQLLSHDAAAPLGAWSTSAAGVVTGSSSTPSAVSLSSGDVLAAVESDSVAQVTTVQRFAAGGGASVDLQLSGYSMPTLATDGNRVWLVMIRSDGFVVSRSFSPEAGWSQSDRVEIGAEGGGGYSWPNVLREADGRLRFIVRGPSGGQQRSAVLAFQRLL